MPIPQIYPIQTTTIVVTNLYLANRFALNWTVYNSYNNKNIICSSNNQKRHSDMPHFLNLFIEVCVICAYCIRYIS